MNRTVLYFFLSTLTSLFLFGCSADDNNQPVAPDLNRAPYSPVLIAPANDSANVPVDAWFYWRCEDEDGDHLTYDVYAGITDPPPLTVRDVDADSVELTHLAYDTLYYWKVVAKDGRGASVSSEIRRFTTSPGELIISDYGLVLENYVVPSDSQSLGEGQRLCFKTDFKAMANQSAVSSLELFLLTELNYQIFENGHYLDAVWHEALDSLGVKNMITEPLAAGWYRVALDFTDWGWRQTNHDDVLDAALIDLSVYRRDY